METPEQAPRVTTIYMLPADVYDQFIADLEAPVGDMEKTVRLFQRPSPFTTDCD